MWLLSALLLIVVSLHACSFKAASVSASDKAPVQEKSAGSNKKQQLSSPMFARFVSERADDFAWENDKVAFRVYGPALRNSLENAGVDCWLKRVPYPIINRWYDLALNQGLSYHQDRGEGLDNYKVGDSLGCGSTALWIEGRAYGLNTFVSWNEPEISSTQLQFSLSYEQRIKGDLYREEKTISLKKGQRLFHVKSRFYKNGQAAANLPIAVGLSAHSHGKISFSDDKQQASVWEKLDDSYLGTALILPDRWPAEPLISTQVNTSADKHALLISRTDQSAEIEYWAGYAWQKAGEITSQSQWLAYLQAFNH
ncbi:DUF4861 family protein [Agaribacterium haliotis]|uniref:DUF4861 family protein n=1 Tax=Agaribacterium haliotis TaxID=2013869 RepID=UPI001177B19A|nr:DUF4861 family protein [Agaribacterium haliotis]